jgi:hypothetical protein
MVPLNSSISIVKSPQNFQYFVENLLNFRQFSLWIFANWRESSELSPMHLCTFANWRKSSVLSPIGEHPLNFRQYVPGPSPIIGESLIGEERISRIKN